MRFRTPLASLLTLFVLLAPPLAADSGVDAGWEKLKSLAGDWTATVDGKPFSVSYKVVSSGTALMETMDGSDAKQMVTMYHKDGPTLLMTHYCAMGNQPRMRASGLEDGKLIFRFVDAANLASPEDPVMSGLVMSFPDADHLVHVWTNRAGGKESQVRFEFARKK